MKNRFLIALVLLGMFSCQKKAETIENGSTIDSTKLDTIDKIEIDTASVSKDTKAVETIRKQLIELLKKDLPVMTKDNRFFYYDTFDLNNDGKEEYFVGFANPYFCGTGGCSGYILNNDGTLINSFTVTDFPIFVATTSSEKFQDLIMKSRDSFHYIKMKNGKYPSNPSVQEKWKGEIPKQSSVLLNIYEGKYEKYSI